jgi:hypothetical protein
MDGGGGDDESQFSISSLSLASRSLATRSTITRSTIGSRSITSRSTVRARTRPGRNRLRLENNNNSSSPEDDGIISWSFLNEHRNLVFILLATYAIHSRKHLIHNLFSARQRQYKYKTINTKELTETYFYKSVSDASFDATKPPSGYPFHRWSSSVGSSSQQQLTGYASYGQRR